MSEAQQEKPMQVNVRDDGTFDRAVDAEVHEGALAVISAQAMELRKLRKQIHILNLGGDQIVRELKIARAEKEAEEKKTADAVTELAKAKAKLTALEEDLAAARGGAPSKPKRSRKSTKPAAP